MFRCSLLRAVKFVIAVLQIVVVSESIRIPIMGSIARLFHHLLVNWWDKKFVALWHASAFNQNRVSLTPVNRKMMRACYVCRETSTAQYDNVPIKACTKGRDVRDVEASECFDACAAQ